MPIRPDLPTLRTGRTFEFTIYPNGETQPLTGYITTSEFDDGRLGEVFLKVSKHGSTLGGLIDSLAILMSRALAAGVPCRDICDWITGVTFEPRGLTNDPDVPEVRSVVDYVARKLMLVYGER